MRQSAKKREPASSRSRSRFLSFKLKVSCFKLRRGLPAHGEYLTQLALSGAFSAQRSFAIL